MSALGIALHLMVAAASASGLHLEAPLALRLEDAPELSARPEAPIAEGSGTVAVERRAHVLGVRPGAWAGAAGATALGDAAIAGLLVLGAGLAVRDELGGGSSGAGFALGGAAAVAYLLAPPLFAAWGAERAGAPSDRRGSAYGMGMLARLVGGGVAYALAAGAQSVGRSDGPTHGGRPVLAGALAVSELVIMPWVVARTLGDEPVSAPPPIDAPASTRARPVRDPALALR
jgi:hypothetical protein